MENERGEQDSDTFFTGLSSYQGTRPGQGDQNHMFSIKFAGISPDKKIKPQLMRFIKFKFETCYDWTSVMGIALECLENYFEDSELQEDVELCIGEWLAQFEGWGLLFTLLPMDFQKFLLVLYTQLKHKYQEENIHKTNEELFEEMLSFYEQETRGLPLKQLIPKVEVDLMNIVGGAKENERNKLLRVKFLSSRFHLSADFIVHKKALRRSLVEIAAEAVAKSCEDVEELEIPETLRGVVIEKIIDADWMASYWFAKYRENRGRAEVSGEAERETCEGKVVTGPGTLVTLLGHLSRGMFRLVTTFFSLVRKGLWIR